MRSLETTSPLVVGSAGVGVTPGPSHWKSGIQVTPIGRVTEQVRVTVSPAMMGEEGEEVREMVVGSVEEVHDTLFEQFIITHQFITIHCSRYLS